MNLALDGGQRGERAAWLMGLALLLAVAALTWLGISLPRPGAQAATSRQVGVVNGQLITLDDFHREVHLQEVKYSLLDQPAREVNEAALLNRMIGDILLLQAADEAQVSVEQAEVQAEIDAILTRLDVSQEEMAQVLDEHGLSWAAFENSVREYLILARFQDEVLLADVRPGERQAPLRAWMSEQYRAADMAFDQAFLDEINLSRASPPP